MPGQSVVRYLRFGEGGRAKVVDRLELRPVVAGRWVPPVPTHPAHLTIHTLEERSGRWRLLKEVELPPDPLISGRGLRQEMTEQEMTAKLQKAMERPPHVIALGGVRTSMLRVECDREHPVWPNHGECNGPPDFVPFALLDSLKAFGPRGRGGGRGKDAAALNLPAWRPPLRAGSIKPAAPRGMRVEQYAGEVRFIGAKLSVGFSLRRPMLLHLGWDGTGAGGDCAGFNRIRRNDAGAPSFGWTSGPVLRTPGRDVGPHHWTGSIEIAGSRVMYRDLDCGLGILLDATFTVRGDGFDLELRQRCDRPRARARALPVIEAEAWRLTLDQRAGMTSVAAVPTLQAGRNGDVGWPAALAADRGGMLVMDAESAAEIPRLQVESFRAAGAVTAGIVLVPRPEAGACALVPAKPVHARIRFEVGQMLPATRVAAGRLPAAIRQYWGAVFSCYRPELGGFSNNAVSVNCHVNQHGPCELAAFTKAPAAGRGGAGGRGRGPDPLQMLRFTVSRALLGGGGYGFHRNLYLDSDPVLVSAAGRIWQARPDREWLRNIGSGLRQATQRMLATIGPEGLAVCRDLSGNSGSFRWSSNAMDVVGFGHIDGYVNAWTYRALRNAAALLGELGEAGDARSAPPAGACVAAADRLREAYAVQLLGRDSGWVAGWKSRDGKLHDAAYLWVNAVACAFGLLRPNQARIALGRLEKLRRRVGAGDARFGLPSNLLPIDTEDHLLPRILSATMPTFETYTDGSMMPTIATYYLRALQIHGLKNEAERLTRDLEAGFLAGHFTGPVGSGVEFRRWDGVPCGYEGSFVLSYGSLYGMAIQRGILSPPVPEWWPG
jgi:hypothetical protein